MPGYGIAAAATTLIGQAIGAGKKDLAKEMCIRDSLKPITSQRCMIY